RLEFEVLILIGVEDGLFPNSRAFDDPQELEEERRLAYVGITRARQQLFVTHAWSRSLFGSTQYNPPSRFLDEIPDQLVEGRGNISGRSAYGRQSLRPRSGWGDPPPYRRRRGVDSDDADEDRRRQDEHRDRVVEAALRAGRPSAPVPKGAGNLGLRIGDDVEHPSFGEGVVIDLRGHGEGLEATINFAGVGTKHLSLAWAPLQRKR
nr:ATP-dependent DNA helicase PcrA [Acidimicrobiia bacterium]